MIEVEKRGLFKSKEEKSKFLEFLARKASLKSQSKQLSIFIESDSPFLGNLQDAKASIAIALTKNSLNDEESGVLKAKFGKKESNSRKEVAIPFIVKEVQQIYDFLSIFHITTGAPRYYKRTDYEYEGFLISIKEDGLAPDHFEIEKEVGDQAEVEDAIVQMQDFVDDFGLEFLTDADYKNLMIKIFNENPPIPLENINLSPIQ